MYIPHWVALPAGIWGAYHLPSLRAGIITLILYLELPFIGFPTAWNTRSAFLHVLLAACIFLPCYLHHHRTAMVVGLVITRLLLTHTYFMATLLAIAISLKIFFVPLLSLFFPNLHLRAATVSLRGGRAIEWRKDQSSLEPDVFIERIGIEVDRRDPKLRRLAIVVKGLVVRVRPSKDKPRRESATEERDAEPQVPEKIKGKWLKALAAQGLHFSIQHWRLPSLLTLHLYDVRVIMEDYQSTEISIAEVQSSLEVTFQSASIDNDKRYDERDYPLAPPCNENGEPLPIPANYRFTRMSAAAWSTWSKANRGWFRMIGRSHGTTTLTTRLRDIEIVHPDRQELSHKESAGTLRPASTARNSSFVSLASLHSRFAPKSTYSHPEGYMRLLALGGEQTLGIAMAFGPRRGLLGEDTLSATVEVTELVSSIEALDRIKQITRARKVKEPRTERAKDWAPTSFARIVLRAIESVSLSVARASVTQHIASQSPHNQHLADYGTSDYTLSVELDDYKLRVSAADASNNRQARNTYGTNQSRESRVRGVGIETSFGGLEVQCVAPWEAAEEKTQLVALRGMTFEALSTWRPSGWCREELLFASDPNLAIFVVNVKLASVDVSAEVGLLKELKDALSSSRPPKESNDDVPDLDEGKPLPPRLRCMIDVKHISVVLADRDAPHQTTLSVVTDGFTVGAFTSYVDLIARRRDRNASKTALKDEQQLSERKKEADLASSEYIFPSRLKPQLRRRHNPMIGHLTDDMAFALQGHAFLNIEPIEVHLSLSHQGSQKTFDLLKISQIGGSASGDMLGQTTARLQEPRRPAEWNAEAEALVDAQNGTRRQTSRAELDSLPTCIESHQLLGESLSCDVDFSVERGIQMELWDMDVLQAVVDLGTASSHSNTPSSSMQSSPAASPKMQAQRPNILSKIPSGIAARLTLGEISIFVGREDPNPEVDEPLTRGLWLCFSVALEYAYYQHKLQTQPSRHYLSAPARHKLDLPEDVVVQALAIANHYSKNGGQAAIFTAGVTDVSVRPIFNGKRFIQKGGTSLKPQLKDAPLSMHEPDDRPSDWVFMRKAPHQDLRKGVFANNVPPLDQSDTDQAQRPLMRLPRGNCTWVLSTTAPAAAVELKLTAKLHTLTIVGDLSHVYCALVTTMALEDIGRSFRHPSRPSAPRQQHVVQRAEVNLNALRVHLALPMGEQVFIASRGLNFKQPLPEQKIFSIDSAIIYVPSSMRLGAWEELSRLKKLFVTVTKTADGPAFVVSGAALRVRIPFAYQMSKLVLNCNVAFKSMKKLAGIMKGQTFSTVAKPVALPAKRVPSIDIHFDAVSLEAKDSPIESRLNLALRVGLIEQEARLELDETFRLKAMLVADAEERARLDPNATSVHKDSHSRLSSKASVSMAEASLRLSWLKSQMWVSRVRAARNEQRRREELLIRGTFGSREGEARLPIIIMPPQASAPLFRASCNGFDMELRRPDMTEKEILNYMSDISDPFDDDTQFTLMLPTQLAWNMDSLTFTLRDYPLPLVRINPIPDGRGGSPRRAWHCETTLIFAEELAGDDSFSLIDSTVIPEGCGSADAPAFKLQIAKTLMPVKTYARPQITIGTPDTTDFTWGNSYQPAIQDFMKVMESLSHPPRDPSTRVGFWDKFRLILHWRVDVRFQGPCHLHLKGSRDPYAVTGNGAGFALVWTGSPHLTIAQPNEQYETIQMHSKSLDITVPDLRNFMDRAAIGSEDLGDEEAREARMSSDRRMTKPCAQFRNGTRVGFGFRFERTCRPWNCDKCGDTVNVLHRTCRVFDFRPHNTVIMRVPEAIKEAEEKVGHPVDSYEGFRSDFIHFSISVVAPANTENTSAGGNSMHFTPKGFAHFFAWWRLFDSKMSLPIRQGKLFPNAPPPSKKFGRSLATIKYRFDLAPLFISHFYPQYDREHGRQGHAQGVGIKARIGRFRADTHQRVQERVVFHERLGRSTTESHKAIYAADVLIDQLQLKGMVLTFKESQGSGDETPELHAFPRACNLPKDLRAWYDFADFIDTDRQPFDRDPFVNLQDIGDCPSFHYSKRIKARKATPKQDASVNDIETSKFGHEQSHICLLGESPSVGEAQLAITAKREAEINAELEQLEEWTGYTVGDKPLEDETSKRVKLLRGKLRLLGNYKNDLCTHDKRHIDDNTLETASDTPAQEESFDNTYIVHCPKIYWNNASRNILLSYWYANRGRRKEDFQKSHSALKAFAEQVQRLTRRQDDGGPSPEDATNAAKSTLQDPAEPGVAAMSMMRELVEEEAKEVKTFDPIHVDKRSLHNPRAGLPEDCTVKPQHHLLMLKPQIALRSDIDDDSVLLLAAEEATFRGYAVLDDSADDPINADVLQRNYANLTGMQGFYPLAPSTSAHRGPDFVPLEVLLDTRSETVDFERILLRTDASLQNDKFNHLRMRRGLQWPTLILPNGQDRFAYLKAHQTLTMVAMPTLAVAATSRHYGALFNIVNNLLLYQDPRARERTKKMESIMLTLDRGEGSTESLLRDMESLQSTVRRLHTLQSGYDMEIDRVTEEGKAELFRIKRDLFDASESLSIAFEALASTQSRADATAALKSSSRLEASIGSLAWTMLLDNYQSLVKIDVRGTRFSWLSNKDGSTDSAIVMRKLTALNSDPDAVFPEIVSMHEGANTFVGSKRRSAETFAASCWSLLSPVGGISMVDYFAFSLHPLRFRMEERLGRQVMRYIFTGHSDKDRDDSPTTTPHSIKAKDAGPEHLDALSVKLQKLAKERSGLHATDAHSLAHLRRGAKNANGQPSEAATPSDSDSSTQETRDQEATEMKKRASSNSTFIRIEVQPTTVVLSFINDTTVKKKRKMGIAMPNVLDFKVKTPMFQFENKTWSMEDLLEQLRKELIQHVWHSKRDLVSQVFSNTDIFRSGKSKLAAALDTSGRGLKNPSSSGLRFNVQPATPTEDSPTERSSLKSPRLDGHPELGSDDEDSPRRRGVRRFLKEKFQKKDPMGSHAGQSTESLRSSPLSPRQTIQKTFSNASQPNLNDH